MHTQHNQTFSLVYLTTLFSIVRFFFQDVPIPISDSHIREKFILDDENDQSILDDHVSLVFPDTPARSPGITSPYKHRFVTLFKVRDY